MVRSLLNSMSGAVSRSRLKPEANHLFVNNVRFWSMLAIIAAHSLIAWPLHGEWTATQNLQIVLLQMMKFGTIGFYLISGFLLGERIDRYSAPEYFRRRMKRVGGPWMVWALLYAVLPLLKTVVLRHGEKSEAPSFAWEIWQRSIEVIFFSTYWFVPNFLFALALLLLCRRYLDDLWFGAVLLGMSLFYGMNVYRQWVPSNHTAAVFGFVFYLWLGNWASRHSGLVFRFLKRVRWQSLCLAIALAGSAALGEACLLRRLGSEDAVNTLRISNQVFSVLVVLGLMKIRHRTWPRWIDVRTSTFGLFLVHPVVALVLHNVIEWVHLRPASEQLWAHPIFGLGVWAGTFPVYYGVSLMVTQALAAQRSFSWMVGQWAAEKTSGGAVCSRRERQAQPVEGEVNLAPIK